MPEMDKTINHNFLKCIHRNNKIHGH